jgi:hypothetical protein
LWRVNVGAEALRTAPFVTAPLAEGPSGDDVLVVDVPLAHGLFEGEIAAPRLGLESPLKAMREPEDAGAEPGR